jgi:hypothetical protein
VRRDELRAAWAIFTPLLHAIDAGDISPEPYPYGSRGPASQDRFLSDSNYLRSVRYIWRPAARQGPAAAATAAAADGSGSDSSGGGAAGGEHGGGNGSKPSSHL